MKHVSVPNGRIQTHNLSTSIGCKRRCIGKDTARMAQSPHQQAEAAYEQILNAIEELALMAAEADEDDDVDYGEIIHHLAEEAGERGLDEEGVNRILKAIYVLTKKAA